MPNRPEPLPDAPPLRALARVIRRRLILERAVDLLAKDSPWAGGGLLLATLAAGLLHWHGRAPALLGLALFIWTAILALRLARAWPQEQKALLHWDARTGRKGRLASAWEFERKDRLTAGERLHYNRTLPIITSVQEELATSFRWPRPVRAWMVLPLSLALLGIAGWQDQAQGVAQRRVHAAQAAEARKQAGQARTVAQKLLDLSAGSPEPDSGLRPLAAALQDTAQRLQSLEPDEATDSPRKLEEQARNLEAYAETLGEAAAPWASREFIRALMDQTGTEPLGMALRDQDAGQGAREALNLAAILGAAPAAGPASQRLGRALCAAAASARKEDGSRPLVQCALSAASGIQKSDWPAATHALKTMADRFHSLERKQNTRSQVEELVETLRRSAEAIAQAASDSPSTAMPELPPPALAGAKPLREHEPVLALEPLTAPPEPEVPPLPAPPGVSAPLPVPGTGEPAASASPGPLPAPPVPGTLPSGQDGPGTMAPAPSAAAWKVAQLAQRLGGLPGREPGVPGMEAGSGRREMKREASAPFETRRDEQVELRRGEQGQSQIREVDSASPRSEAARAAEWVATAFHSVEEAAQHGPPLPAARRHQVERYFRGVRQQLEAAAPEVRESP